MPIGAYVPLQEVIMTVYARKRGEKTKERSDCAHMALLRRVCLSKTAVKVHADRRRLPCSDPDTTTGLVLRSIVVFL